MRMSRIPPVDDVAAARNRIRRGRPGRSAGTMASNRREKHLSTRDLWSAEPGRRHTIQGVRERDSESEALMEKGLCVA